jgi:hypothetical protein
LMLPLVYNSTNKYSYILAYVYFIPRTRLVRFEIAGSLIDSSVSLELIFLEE